MTKLSRVGYSSLTQSTMWLMAHAACPATQPRPHPVVPLVSAHWSHWCHVQVSSGDYWAVLVTSAAEIPAVAWAAVSIRSKWLGRRRAIAVSLGLTGLCLLPCIVVAAAGSSLAAASQVDTWKHDLANSASGAAQHSPAYSLEVHNQRCRDAVALLVAPSELFTCCCSGLTKDPVS